MAIDRRYVSPYPNSEFVVSQKSPHEYNAEESGPELQQRGEIFQLTVLGRSDMKPGDADEMFVECSSPLKFDQQIKRLGGEEWEQVGASMGRYVRGISIRWSPAVD